MHQLMKQSKLLAGKLANNYCNIKYFSAGLNFNWIFLSWMGGAIVSQGWPKITFLQLSGLKSTFTAQLSQRKVSNNYKWVRGFDRIPWTWPEVMFSCQNGPLKFGNCQWLKNSALIKKKLHRAFFMIETNMEGNPGSFTALRT